MSKKHSVVNEFSYTPVCSLGRFFPKCTAKFWPTACNDSEHHREVIQMKNSKANVRCTWCLRPSWKRNGKHYAWGKESFICTICLSDLTRDHDELKGVSAWS